MSDFHLAFQESGSLPYFCVSANESSLQFAMPVLGQEGPKGPRTQWGRSEH